MVTIFFYFKSFLIMVKAHSEDTPPASPNLASLEMDLVESDSSDEEFPEAAVPVVEVDDIFVEALDDEEEGEDGAAAGDEENHSNVDDAEYVFANHTGSVFCCNLCPNSAMLAVTGGEDDKAYVWHTHTGEVIFECTGHSDSVICAEFNHDGTYVVSGDMSGIIKVWKLSTKKSVWEASIGDLSWLKWHPGANVIMSAAMTGDVYLWKIPSGECKVFSGHGEKPDCGIFLPDGKRCCIGYSDGSIKVFDMKATTVLHRIEAGVAHNAPITYMDCHPDNNLVLTCGIDGRVALIKTQTGKILGFLKEYDETGSSDTDLNDTGVETVGFCKDPGLSLAATGNLEGDLCIYDFSRQVLRSKIKQKSGITKLVWLRNSPMLYTGDLDGVIRLYDARSGELQSELKGHVGDILDFSLSADNSILLSASDDRTARVFSLVDPDR